MTNRDVQKAKRREKILLAGLDLFVKNGYAATKTCDIAKEVPMSEGLLFHYFVSKEKLYEELIRIGMENSQVWMESATTNSMAFFNAITQQILEMVQQNPQRAKYFILMAQALRSSTTPEGVLRILAPQSARYTKTVALIRDGQQAGDIRSGNPEALAYTFWCSIQGIVEQLAIYPQTPLPEAEWIVSILKNTKGAAPNGTL